METTTIDPKTTIAELENALVTHLNDRNVNDLVKAFYAENCQFHVPNAPPAVGKQAVTETFQAMIDNGLKDLALTTVDVGGNGNTIWNRGQYDLVMETPGGTINDVGTYVTIFEKQDDGAFRCVVDIFNSDQPA